MAVRVHPHARERMAERGASEEEVRATVEHGESFPRSSDARVSDETFGLTRIGGVGIITPNRLKLMQSRKARTGWSLP